MTAVFNPMGRLYSKTIIIRGDDTSAPPPPNVAVAPPIVVTQTAARPTMQTMVLVRAPIDVTPPPAAPTPPPTIVLQPKVPVVRGSFIGAAAAAEIYIGATYITTPFAKVPWRGTSITQQTPADTTPPPPATATPPPYVIGSTATRRAQTFVLTAKTPLAAVVVSSGPVPLSLVVTTRRVRILPPRIRIWKAYPPHVPSIGAPDFDRPTSMTLDANSNDLILDAHTNDLILDSHTTDLVLDENSTTLTLDSNQTNLTLDSD